MSLWLLVIPYPQFRIRPMCSNGILSYWTLMASVFWLWKIHLISSPDFVFSFHFWGYTDMRWLCSICNVHIFEDFFPCHVWCPFDEKPHMSKKSRHSIRGRRVDPWQKRCHRHWLWLWISENSGNWWDLIHSDIYIYTHTIPLPYLTLHYIHIIHTHTHIAIGWMIYGILSAWEWR